MSVFFGIIAFITWWAFVVGMVSPKLVRMKGRKQVALVYLITSLVCSIISGATSKPEQVQQVATSKPEQVQQVIKIEGMPKSISSLIAKAVTYHEGQITRIRDKKEKIEAFEELSDIYFTLENDEKGFECLFSVRELSEDIPSYTRYDKAALNERIIGKYLKIGRYDEALVLARKQPRKYGYKIHALLGVACYVGNLNCFTRVGIRCLEEEGIKGDKERAYTILKEALRNLEQLSNDEKGETLRDWEQLSTDEKEEEVDLKFLIPGLSSCGKYEEALEYCDKFKAALSYKVDVMVKIADDLAKAGKKDDARKVCEMIAKLTEGHTSASAWRLQYKFADVMAKIGERESALLSYKVALQNEKADLVLVCRHMIDAGFRREALEVSKQIKKRSTIISVKLYLARIYTKEGKAKEAIQILDEVVPLLTTADTTFRGWYYKDTVNLYVKNGAIDKAKQAAWDFQVKIRDIQNCLSLSRIARILCDADEKNRTEYFKLFNKALGLAKEKSTEFTLIGDVMAEIARHMLLAGFEDEAEDLFVKAIKHEYKKIGYLSPVVFTTAIAYKALAEKEMKRSSQKKQKESQPVQEVSAKTKEKADAVEAKTELNTETHYNKEGISYGKLGRYQEAIEAFKQAIKVKPDYSKAHYNLGLVYYKLERYQEAIEAFKQAIRIDPDFANAHHNLGVGYLLNKDKDSALGQYKILKELDKDLAEKLYNEIYK